MVSNIHIDPFDRVKTYSIGFDRMFNSLLDAPASTGYPPYNIVKTSEEKYCIERTSFYCPHCGKKGRADKKDVDKLK